MAECEWIILCDYAFYAMPGKLSLIGVFDVIFAEDVPARHPRAFIGMNVIGQPGESVVQKFEIIGPSGRALTAVEQRYTLSDAGSVQIAIELHDLVLEEYGRHALQVDFGRGETKAAWFTLQKVPAQNQT